jgi:hypothetical protein
MPSHLVGTWGTGASLWAGDEKQTELHLLADGFGALAGSSPPARRLDGVKQDRAPRVIMGFPFMATLDGNKLTLVAQIPKNDHDKESAGFAVICHHEAAGSTLTCIGPDMLPIVMKRRSDTVSAEFLNNIEKLRPKLEQQNKLR